MKKRNFRLKIGILIYLLFTISCTDRTIELFSICNFEFTSVTSNGTALIDSEQNIRFLLTKTFDNTCNTSYNMRYTVKRNGFDTNDGIFNYNDTVQAQTEEFAIEPIDFTGTFTTTQPGNYAITFTITNNTADNAIQTQTLQLVFTE